MHRKAKVEFYTGGSLGKVQRAHRFSGRTTELVGGRRGTVQTFSKASRRRLLRQVAKVRRDVPTLFITLTYPDIFPTDPTKWKRDLKTFAERLKRYCPEASLIWRLELQVRKSGVNEGKIAPHYHLLVYGLIDSKAFEIDKFRFWLSESWFQVVGSHNEKHLLAGTNCTVMRSWQGSMAYAAKYLTKIEENSYENIGRHWGVYFRGDLPEAESVALEITDEQAVKIIRWFRKFSGVSNRSYESLTIFLNASHWLESIERMIDEENLNK